MNSAEERFLKLLSPELQDEIRKQRLIPHFPTWPEKTRGVPNLCLRSSLFRVIQRGRRKAVKGEIVSSIKGLNISYTGWRLDQGDFDVLLQALHLQSRHIEKTSENHTRFAVKSFLSSIGRHPGKSGRDWMIDCFLRLTATAVEINVDVCDKRIHENFTYAGSLVDEFIYDKKQQIYSLKINPKLAELFETGWTQLQWQQRLELKTDLAKWLHGFYSSHQKPYPMKVATLKHLCGSECKRLVDYRRNLRVAMTELVKVGAIRTWEIDNTDKVHVQKIEDRPRSR